MNARTLNEELLEEQLYASAFDFSTCWTFGDGSTFGVEEGRALFADLGVAPSVLNFFRAAGATDGRGVFVWLARRRALVVEENGWGALPEATRAYFDALARLTWAFTATPPVSAEAAPVKVVAAGRPRVRDTIFAKFGRSDEKIGGDDLSPGQPISTARVHIEHARAAPAPPADLNNLTMEQKLALMKQFGLEPPIEGDRADAAKVNAAIRARLGGPPDMIAQPVQAVDINAFEQGAPVKGRVYIQKPPVLRANTPAALRVDDDLGPEQDL